MREGHMLQQGACAPQRRACTLQWKPGTTIITTTVWKVNKISLEILFRTTPAFRKKKKKGEGEGNSLLVGNLGALPAEPSATVCRLALLASSTDQSLLPAFPSSWPRPLQSRLCWCLCGAIAKTPTSICLSSAGTSSSTSLPEEPQNKNSNPSTQL